MTSKLFLSPAAALIFVMSPAALFIANTPLLAQDPSEAPVPPAAILPVDPDPPSEPQASARRGTLFTPLSVSPLATSWIPQGPGPILNGQVENILPNNEVIGAIHTVAAHPTDPDVLYVGAVNGGVWRTINARATSPTWTPLTDDFPSLSIGALEFDPLNQDRLLAGIGHFSSLARFGDPLTGLLLSEDSGDTWRQIDHPLLLGQNISGVAIRGSLLLAAANNFGGGLFRSVNSGIDWTRISGGSGLPAGAVFDLVGDLTNRLRFYVSVQGAGIFHTDDGGLSWVNVSDGDPFLRSVITSPNNNNAEMAVATNGRLFVAVLVSGRVQYIGYADAPGSAWTAMDLPQTLELNGEVEGLNPSGGGLGAGGQGIIHFSICVDPTDSNIVYVAGDRQDSPFPNFLGANDFSGRLFRGDITKAATGQVPSPQWEHLTHRNDIAAIPGGGTGGRSSPHADSREMTFDAAGDLIEVDDGGIYRRTEPRSNTGDWFSISGNIQVTEFHDIAYDSVSNVIIGGAQDTGTSEQIAPGSTTWRSVSTADGGGVEVDDISLPGFSIRYSSFQNFGGFRRRTYSAANTLVSQVFPPLTVTSGNPLTPQFYTPVKLNTIDPTRLVIGGVNSVYESFDQGNSIAEIARGITINDSLGMEAIAYGGRRAGVDNPDVLYVGSGSRLFIRVGPSPAILTQATTYPGGVIRDIALDPDDWMTAFVISNNQVYVTSDAGVSWNQVTGNLSDLDLRAITVVPGSTDSIFVGGSSGVFRMCASMPAVWEATTAGLPGAVVFDLDYDPADDLLVAGTLGRGAWILPNASQEPSGQLVNSFVSFEPLPSTFATSPDTSGCPSGFVVRFTFGARITNGSSGLLLSGLRAQVVTLTNGNVLQNSDLGARGLGASLTVPRQDGFADGLLAPGESVDALFAICLTEVQPFEFFVNLLADVDDVF